MIRLLKIFVTTLICLFALQACRNDVEEPTPGLARDVQMQFTISIGNTSADGGSRAPSTPEGGYDRGDGYENYIDLTDYSNIRFWLFDAEKNSFLSELQITTVMPVESTESSKRYYVLASLPRKTAGFNPSTTAFKVMVAANWGTYPTPSAGQHIDRIVEKALFDYSAGMPSAETPVPLYGIKRIEPLDFSTSDFASLGRIHLLRAVAKIEVKAAEDSNPIESVSLLRYNTRGYCAPKGVYAEEDYVKGSYDKDYVATPSIPAGVASKLSLPLQYNATTGSWIIYVPEYDNLSVRSERAQLMVRFEGMADESAVEFHNYASAMKTPFNLLRNNWYIFNVRRTGETEVDIDVEVQVVPYNEVSLNPDFGLRDDFDGYVPIFDENRNIIYYYDSLHGKYYKEEHGKLIEVENPYFQSTDPGTGYSIVRDNYTGDILYYFDRNNDIYYLPDRFTECMNPYTGQYTDPTGRYNAVIRKDNRMLLYFHDTSTGRLYASDGKTRIYALWSTNTRGIVGLRIPATEENPETKLHYFNTESGKYFKEDSCKTEITPTPFPVIYYP